MHSIQGAFNNQNPFAVAKLLLLACNIANSFIEYTAVATSGKYFTYQLIFQTNQARSASKKPFALVLT
jgi:hypothetical protein